MEAKTPVIDFAERRKREAAGLAMKGLARLSKLERACLILFNDKDLHKRLSADALDYRVCRDPRNPYRGNVSVNMIANELCDITLRGPGGIDDLEF